MLDLLAAIQSADPPSLVLWSLFVLAAGMYPVGFMLGSTCSPCCGAPPCSQCTTGELPDTVTVTFDGFTDQSPGPDLISLSFSSCFGGGASARVTAPGGDPDTDKGPISAVSLTSAGSGYAKLGRVAPTLTVSGGSGTGATFTPTITSSNDACGVPSWTIASVSVKDGTGYVDGESLAVTIAEGDAEATAASVIVNTTRTQPTLTASASPGSGAVFSVTMSQNFGSPSTWGVASVTVTNGGTGYTDGDNLTFAGGSATKVNEEASAYIRTGRSIPTLIGSVDGTGSSAAVTPTLTEYTDYYGGSYWSVTGFTITNGGSGYYENDPVSVTVTDGTSGYFSYFYAYVSSVDEDGAITGIAIDWGGEFYKDTGVIQSVELWWGGSYYDDDGIPTGVTVSDGGQYYREDASEPPYVADITISISQQGPSDGTGAEITATVDDDTSSPTFGRITGLTIEDGGTGYLGWMWKNTKCCGAYYNGMSVVLKRRADFPCVYDHKMCGVGNLRRSPGVVSLTYLGPSSPPIVSLTSESHPDGNTSSICNTAFTATENVTDCSSWSGSSGPIIANSAGGATATITSGGTYDEMFRNPGGRSCHVCCRGESVVPVEIEMQVSGTTNGRDGTYVLSALADFFLAGSGVGWVYMFGFNDAIEVKIYSCGAQSPTSWDNGEAYGLGDCDHCWKKCVTAIIGSLGANYETVSACSLCEDSPMCVPSGTHQLTKFGSPSATVSFSQ